MPSTGHPTGDLLIYVAAILVALGTIYRYVWPAIRGGYHVARTLEQGAIDYRSTGGFGGLSVEIATIKKELHPNGGSSLRDAVDKAAARAEEASADARAAVTEAQRVGTITEELRGYAAQNREGIASLREGQADVSRRLTDEAEKTDHLAERITTHKRKNDEQAALLQARVDRELADKQRELDDQRLANEGLRSAVTELLAVDAAETRLRPDEQPDL